jgi:hypothetical protein
MLQHAERMMSAVDSSAARAGRPDQVSHGGTEAQRKRGLALHPLRAARVRTEGAMFLSVPPCLRERLPHRTQHAIGGRNHECPSDGVRTKFGRSLRNGWCGSRLRRLSFRRLKPAGTRGVRLRRSEPSDSQGRGARMLQHAERVMSAVDPDTNGSADSRLQALVPEAVAPAAQASRTRRLRHSGARW